MDNSKMLREIACSLPEVTEEPHFDKISFRINKKIFATVVAEQNRATVKLTPEEQDIFCTFNNEVIHPIPNKWGKQGWTHINLLLVQANMLTGILKTAYCGIAPKHLAAQITFEED
ncbi:MmcQ/YjbR family DNA-binding protein [Mucilaginibacter achroorhodeus]|uniref:MmcQ/YjbR family DNA-binding protein n=1 Tax=Mucilaginibacter achroorhodeus TaxID=2599294 RepID=A0A563U6Y6_9SPHI|nr:MmcQ/YjbR family DNA-binding protein [Mucilaginibacter achroorhodeus]TWR27108.1 MmcQ/YjbR family DNA-binding protein [Mucilaginibacter achroorhodeus]